MTKDRKTLTLRKNTTEINNVSVECPLFIEYQKPKGFLCPERACHGLFYYYLLARNTWEQEQANLVLEDQPDFRGNYRQLFITVATLYGAQPEYMVNHWACVDMQCTALVLPKLRETDELRHNRNPEIRTQ